MSTARTGTRSSRTRSMRSLRVDSMNGKLLPQDWGSREVIHGRERKYMALEDVVSMKDKGERF